jgi:3-dehydroquinate synthase
VQEVRLLTSRIFIWPGVHAEAGENIRVLSPDSTKAFILTDRNCVEIAKRVVMGLWQAKIEVAGYSIFPGEMRKSLATAAEIYDRLAQFRMDRSSAFVAVGGGVVTDLGGFVASTYMRGVPCFLVPTTLLGMVDAAVGGKTAVNLHSGKNLVGTFHQPLAVFSDPTVLQSLPPREYTGGLGEVIKYGMIQDAELFSYIESNIEGIRERAPQLLEEIIYRCSSIKSAIVEQDEKESGLRAILNYGHTIGHGLEAAGEFKRIHHGEAISIGMEAEGLIAREMGLAPQDALTAQNKILKLCGLPTRVKGLPHDIVLKALELDKKGRNGANRFVLPEAIGRVRYPVEVPTEVIKSALATVIPA